MNIDLMLVYVQRNALLFQICVYFNDISWKEGDVLFFQLLKFQRFLRYL